MKIPATHPRFRSLQERKRIERGIRRGVTHPQGLIAHGRGEAFDYLIGEKTRPFAKSAIRCASTMLLLAKKPVISVNGNIAALCPKEIAELARELNAKIEVNLFYRTEKRARAIAKEFKRFGVIPLGIKPDGSIRGLGGNRGKVSKEGIFSADVVLIPLEDGDRTEALKRLGKKTIAIDLNPLSRTAQKADVTIVDNVTRAIPLLTMETRKLKGKTRGELVKIIKKFKNKENLKKAVAFIRRSY